MNQHDARMRRQLIEKLADEWREIARGVPPWKTFERDGETLLWSTREGGQLATLQGQWATGVARYLDTIHPLAGFQLAELLWNIGGHGTPSQVEASALRLLETMGLKDNLSPTQR
jgi:hypothetical protein